MDKHGYVAKVSTYDFLSLSFWICLYRDTKIMLRCPKIPTKYLAIKFRIIRVLLIVIHQWLDDFERSVGAIYRPPPILQFHEHLAALLAGEKVHDMGGAACEAARQPRNISCGMWEARMQLASTSHLWKFYGIDNHRESPLINWAIFELGCSK